jgi:voltage-gated potassium channel
MLAGANEMVSPSSIGGLRMVSLLVRPSVVTFLDKMLRDPDEATRIEEMKVAGDSDIANKTLAEARLRDRASVLVLAVKPPDKQQFLYRPTPETKLSPGTVVVLMGEVASIRKARMLAGMVGLPGMETENL